MARERILVVDDEPGVRRAIERVLSRRYDVTPVTSGEEALEVIASTRYELVLADVRMPGMSGLELLGRIRAQADADVIIMTGSLGEGDERLLRAIQGGAYFFLEKPFERPVLEAIVERCMATRRIAHANKQYLEEMERSLDQARRFQQGLYPRRVPVVPGARIAGRVRPTERVGGDLYDFVLRADGALDVFICDVSGHGVGAAMFTGIVKVAFRRLLWEADAEDRAAYLYRELRAAAALMGAASFLTAVYAMYDPAERVLRYWNAGHPPFVRLGSDGLRPDADSTMPLVSPSLPAAPVVVEEIALSPGEQVLFYTDGLPDARNPTGETLPMALVYEALADTRGAAPAEALYRIEEEVDAFRAGRPLDDDVTLMLLSVDA
jgi:sigma-B regulation protein RsbU (phosphoserine phosphatase)